MASSTSFGPRPKPNTNSAATRDGSSSESADASEARELLLGFQPGR